MRPPQERLNHIFTQLASCHEISEIEVTLASISDDELSAFQEDFLEDYAYALAISALADSQRVYGMIIIQPNPGLSDKLHFLHDTLLAIEEEMTFNRGNKGSKGQQQDGGRPEQDPVELNRGDKECSERN